MSYPLVLGSPAPGPTPTPVNWRGLSSIWEGPDGSVWNMTDRLAGGPFLVEGGVEGLHFPRMTKYKSRARGIPGTRPRGWRAEAREVFWPLYLWADGSDDWLRRHAAFFATIHPERAGTWRVKSGEQERTLRLTGVFTEAYQYALDPLSRGWSLIPVTLEADQPFWEGQTIRRGPWSAPDPSPFIPAGGGPPFTISSSSAFGSASIPNPGDVEAWGVWSATGPLNEITLGVDGAIITVPFALELNDVLIIDTDPRHPTALLNDVDITEQLGLQDYAAVPPSAEVDLHVQATGPGRIMFDLVPLYFRAF